MEELKPCPFCGGKAVLHVDGGAFVVCQQCECRTMALRDGQTMGKYTSGAVERVIKKWNKRVTVDSSLMAEPE